LCNISIVVIVGNMHQNIEVKSWVGVSGECPISYRTDGHGAVHFMFGDPPNDFEFGFDLASLGHFLNVGGEALREMAGEQDPSPR
jgi:hypothetical protein